MRALSAMVGLFLLVLISGCLGSGGATSNETGSNNETVQSLNTSICQEIANNTLSSTCMASLSGNISYCSNLGSVDEKDSCYAYYAITLKNISACSGISSQDFKVNCMDLAYYSIALDKNDVAFCANLSGNSEGYVRNCYGDVAYHKKDLSLCGGLDENSSEICRWAVLDQPLSGSWDYDLVRLSGYLSLFSSGTCNEISGTADKTICSAVVERNPSACSYFNLNDFITTYETNQTVAAIYYNLCIRDVVLVNEDPSLCNKTSVGKDECFETIAILKKDPSILKNLNYSKFLASSKMAIYWNDSSVCSSAGNSTEVKLCLDYFYLGTGNTTFCKNLTDERIRDGCFATAAKVSGDSKFCAELKDNSSKDLCYLKSSLTSR